MVSSSITPIAEAQSTGKVVFNYNWGANGFLPTANLNADGEFNMLGMYFIPAVTPPSSLIGTSPTNYIGSVDQSLADIQANGDNASTYMTCTLPGNNSSSTCGGDVPVPEPLNILGSIAGLALFGATSAALKRKAK